MKKDELKEFLSNYHENENPDDMDACDEWYSELNDAVVEHFNVKLTSALQDKIELALDEL